MNHIVNRETTASILKDSKKTLALRERSRKTWFNNKRAAHVKAMKARR